MVVVVGGGGDQIFWVSFSRGVPFRVSEFTVQTQGRRGSSLYTDSYDGVVVLTETARRVVVLTETARTKTSRG